MEAARGADAAGSDSTGAGPEAGSPTIQTDAGATPGGGGTTAACDAGDEAATMVWTVSAFPGEEAAKLAKMEPTLRVPIGCWTAAASSGRERRAAREAGRNPAVVEPEAATLVMAAEMRSGVGATAATVSV